MWILDRLWASTIYQSEVLRWLLFGVVAVVSMQAGKPSAVESVRLLYCALAVNLP